MIEFVRIALEIQQKPPIVKSFRTPLPFRHLLTKIPPLPAEDEMSAGDPAGRTPPEGVDSHTPDPNLFMIQS